MTYGFGSFLEFVTGYTLEKSLSVDNMFVFIIIFSSLGIPHRYQHKVLSVGIISAIAMRIPLIIAGASLLESFHWMMYVFGAFLLVTAIRMALQRREKENIDIEKHIAVRLLKKFIPLTPQLHENKFLVRLADGILYATPMLVALVIVEMTDLVFAIDSIPAVLAVTTDPLIVITSNIFAILGLRSLYFLLAGMMEKFHYLKPALIALLIFIGAKMLLSDLYKIPMEVSLTVIFAILGIALGASALRARAQDKSHTTLRK
jgi:tellurite resistance protein TerC